MNNDALDSEHSGRLEIDHLVTEGNDDLPLVQRWTSSALWHQSNRNDETSEHLGYVTWVLADLAHGARQALIELDALGSDEETMAAALIQLEDNHQLPGLSTAAMLITHATVLERVRGTGLGRLIVKESVRFATFGRLEFPVLLQPQPTDWDQMESIQLTLARERLRLAWANLGFSPIEVGSDVAIAFSDDITRVDPVRQAEVRHLH